MPSSQILVRVASCGALSLLASPAVSTRAQEPPPAPPSPDAGGSIELPRGVLARRDGAAPGYTLIAPFNVGETYLIDLDGNVVHEWRSEFPPGQTVELLDDGRLLRAARDPGESPLRGGGEGGRIEEFDWDGNLLWTYVCCDETRRQHHDFEPLPNGNVVLIAWEAKTLAEAVERGRDPEAARDGLWPDCLLEVKPQRPVGGEIVWEWHVWDHLVQDRDPSLPDFGVIADHPGRIDVNALRRREDAPPPGTTADQAAALRALGYAGGEEGGDEAGAAGDEDAAPPPADRARGPRRGRGFSGADWNHLNSVAWHAGLDQLVVSSHNQHEVWIVDHSTTSEEAAGSSGGRSGRGGDLLYRWGNPQAWQAGGADAQQLFGQHDARWVPEGLPGAGHLLIFNNNVRRGFGGPRRGAPRGPDGEESLSFALELALPLQAGGTYARADGQPFGPDAPCWRWGGGPGEARFFSPIVSGTQRLHNGNTLISSGAEGYCVEVDREGQVVWEFRNPFGRLAQRGAPRGEGEQGAGRFGGRGGPGGFNGAFYRAHRYAPDHPALRGRKLVPRQGA